MVLATAIGCAAADTKMVSIVIDGETSAEKAVVIGGDAYLPLSLLSKLQGKVVKYDAQNERVIVGAEATGGTENIKPVLEVTMGDPEYNQLIEGMGLSARKETAVPEKLEFYSCIILNNDNAVSPKIAQRLKSFVEKGGGLVMHGETPLRLAGTEQGKQVWWAGTASDDVNLSSIADWFGCTTSYTVQVNGGSLLPITMTSKASKPFGSDIARNTWLIKHKGDTNYSMLADPDEFCEVIALWSSDTKAGVPSGEDKWPPWVAAFIHPYGKGHIYWQSVVYDANYPKLAELFRAGIYRAATGMNLGAR